MKFFCSYCALCWLLFRDSWIFPEKTILSLSKSSPHAGSSWTLTCLLKGTDHHQRPVPAWRWEFERTEFALEISTTFWKKKRKPFMNWADRATNVVYWERRAPFHPDACNEIFTTKVYRAEGFESSKRNLELPRFTKKKKKFSPGYVRSLRLAVCLTPWWSYEETVGVTSVIKKHSKKKNDVVSVIVTLIWRNPVLAWKEGNLLFISASRAAVFEQ